MADSDLPEPPTAPRASARPRDPYGRVATSNSRGRTHERILAMAHDPSTIPGAEELLADAPPGSTAQLVCAFHAGWVAGRTVTVRRAYERTLALWVRHLAECGPHPREDAAPVDARSLATHLDWRIACGFTDAGELRRVALHLARLEAWGAVRDERPLALTRDDARTVADSRLATVPPPFHTAATADELRGVDTGR